MKKIHLLLGIHNHQPVGNFEHIFKEAFDRSYQPFIQLLQKHPHIKATLHFSGSLLEWPYRITVLPSVYAQPDHVDFQTVSAARLVKPMEREIQLVALPGLEFDVTGVQAEGGLFLLRKERRAGLPWKIIVTLPAGSKRGIYRDRILIETTAKQAPRMYVKVSAVVK